MDNEFAGKPETGWRQVDNAAGATNYGAGGVLDVVAALMALATTPMKRDNARFVHSHLARIKGRCIPAKTAQQQVLISHRRCSTGMPQSMKQNVVKVVSLPSSELASFKCQTGEISAVRQQNLARPMIAVSPLALVIMAFIAHEKCRLLSHRHAPTYGMNPELAVCACSLWYCEYRFRQLKLRMVDVLSLRVFDAYPRSSGLVQNSDDARRTPPAAVD